MGVDWFVAWSKLDLYRLGIDVFFLIAFEKVTGFGKLLEKLPVLGNLYTLFFVLLGWVLFRAGGGFHAVNYLLAMFGLKSNPFTGRDTYIVIEYSFTWIIGIIGCLPVARMFTQERFSGKTIMLLFKWAFFAFVLLLSMVLINGSNYNPFIYFNF